jgi:prefoldin subunit 5
MVREGHDMATIDELLEVLREIRDELRTLNATAESLESLVPVPDPVPDNHVVLREIRDELRTLNATAETVRDDVSTIDRNVDSLESLVPVPDDGV